MGEDRERERTIFVDTGMLSEFGLHVLLTSPREGASIEEKGTKQLRRNKGMSGGRRITMNVRNGNPRRESVRKMRGSKEREARNTEEMLGVNGLYLLNRKIMARRDIMNGIAR